MASGPITSWEIDGETVETVSDFVLGAPKSLQTVIAAVKFKRRLLHGRKVMTNLESILKSRDNKGPCQQRSVPVQFSSVAQSCLTVCDPMNRSTPGLPVHHQLLEFTQTHVHRVSDAIQPSHPLSSPSPCVPNPSQHQSLS